MSTLGSIGRGAQAGLAAGVLTVGFGYWLAEPLLDKAVDLESARSQAEHAVGSMPMEEDPFSRHTQHVGFGLAILATAVALGVLFGLVHALLHRDEGTRPWRTALWLAAGAFFAVYLVPFVRYPANPPGVGDPGTLSLRTNVYLATLVIGVVGCLVAALVARDTRGRGWAEPSRQLAVVGVLLLTLALPFTLPDNPDALDIPAGLLWQYRLVAFGSAALLWAGLGVAFGLLGEHRRARLAAG